ncbi:class I SAM-dependent methyltransferase [Rhizobium leguminosarum]|uniref:class I SAM-dependent methyltransferase n=2 Tax=Rhizobium TaxID=379 RepID=UPI001C905BF2|nr:class I SAM-dependent methyltransferase [Rhizobium leguminosarum]MBY2919786.1 class I SAM-dependent methyltransferase [Rhizobium leguminosarum]MBY2975484.1 class I SAM-dependent methyltransferase [Rhizobium leguminosarum]MBY2982855.1 class I SAM-dependent methyltransferase [Rhizobium leguminosarum]MBY2989399.1 class I SAM-dependent methyltransferase [Rhizobium leguminosarum]MBY3011409.1 class I SAM-dependent methyltransferase [Rhizobium leguminosarum]
MNNRYIAGGYNSLQLNREGQAEAFDAIGARYNETFPHKQGQVSAGDWLIKSLPTGSRVLDLGCGTGVPTARQLAASGFEVVGIDLSGGMVKLAREYVPGATFHQLDIADLRPGGPRDLGQFDAVTAFFSLLMLPRAEIPLALMTIRNLLVPGGLFALSMVEADVDDFSIPFLGNTIRVSGYLREDLRAVIGTAGFQIVEETSYAYAAAVDVPPEEQIFLCCRMSFSRSESMRISSVGKPAV